MNFQTKTIFCPRAKRTTPSKSRNQSFHDGLKFQKLRAQNTVFVLEGLFLCSKDTLCDIKTVLVLEGLFLCSKDFFVLEDFFLCSKDF